MLLFAEAKVTESVKIISNSDTARGSIGHERPMTLQTAKHTEMPEN